VAIRTPKLSLFQAHDNSCFSRIIVIIPAAGKLEKAEALVESAGGEVRFADFEQEDGRFAELVLNQQGSNADATILRVHREIENLAFGWG
jgi:hypothetical protein